MYQMMDPLFVGIIFSVYQSDTGSTGNHVQVTCFQAYKAGSEYQRREIELVIENISIQRYNLESKCKVGVDSLLILLLQVLRVCRGYCHKKRYKDTGAKVMITSRTA